MARPDNQIERPKKYRHYQSAKELSARHRPRNWTTLVSSQQASTLPQKVLVEFGMRPLGGLSKRRPNVRMVQQGVKMLSGREVLARHEKRPLVDIIYVYFEPKQGRLFTNNPIIVCSSQYLSKGLFS